MTNPTTPTPSRPRLEQSPYLCHQPKQTPTPTSASESKNRTDLYVGIAVVVLLALGCAVLFTNGFGLFDESIAKYFGIIVVVLFALGCTALFTNGFELFDESIDEKKQGMEVSVPEETLALKPVPASGTKPNETTPTSAQEPMPEPGPDHELAAPVHGNYIERVNGLDMKMIRVEGGEFMMGGEDSDAEADEKPVHHVTLGSYYISETVVTQAQWEKIMGTSIYQQAKKVCAASYYGEGPYYPMYYVSWEEAHEFCRKLRHLTGRKYRLPTEAQWEYAARGGKNAPGTKYSGCDSIDAVAWYCDNSGSSTQPVKFKKPNRLGLYDMSGNVYEWCYDRYGGYNSNDTDNPIGSSYGIYRVLRGGSWYSFALRSRVSARNFSTPHNRGSNCGFRVVAVR